MVALSPLVPVVGAVNSLTQTKRPLVFPEMFRLGDGLYAISNYRGWFTDRSEMPPPGKGTRAYSAWIVDISASERDNQGRIVLSEKNLDRWFFRDCPLATLSKVQEASAAGTTERFTFKPGSASLTLILSDTKSVTFYLSQE